MQIRRACTLAFLVSIIVFAGCKKGPSQEQLFEEAKKYQEQGNFQAAIQSYETIVKKFPRSPEAPQCQFMVGYLYANHMKNNDLARNAYQTFIKNYPEHELVKDAQWELDHLGQDVNQIEELNRALITKGDTVATKPDTVHKH
jgi:outer membrane protein assembly factor BamD (BamD/ComL family)